MQSAQHLNAHLRSACTTAQRSCLQIHVVQNSQCSRARDQQRALHGISDDGGSDDQTQSSLISPATWTCKYTMVTYRHTAICYTANAPAWCTSSQLDQQYLPQAASTAAHCSALLQRAGRWRHGTAASSHHSEPIQGSHHSEPIQGSHHSEPIQVQHQQLPKSRAVLPPQTCCTTTDWRLPRCTTCMLTKVIYKEYSTVQPRYLGAFNLITLRSRSSP